MFITTVTRPAARCDLKANSIIICGYYDKKTNHPMVRVISIWQEWAEGFQTLDEALSVNLTPEEEHRIKQLLDDKAADNEETVY